MIIKLIKKIWLTSALLTVIGLLGYPAFAENYPSADGTMSGLVFLKDKIKAPNTPFEDEFGNIRRLSDFKNKVILINFWASWCAPCLHEMPSLDRLQAEMGNDDFEVVAINQDIKGLKVAKRILREKLNLHNLDLFLDPKINLGRDFNIKNMPVTFIIDSDGKIFATYVGPAEWDSPDAKVLLKSIIEKQK